MKIKYTLVFMVAVVSLVLFKLLSVDLPQPSQGPSPLSTGDAPLDVSPLALRVLESPAGEEKNMEMNPDAKPEASANPNQFKANVYSVPLTDKVARLRSSNKTRVRSD